MKKFIKKILKFSAVFIMTLVFGFSNFVSFLPQGLQNNKLAEKLKIPEAYAAPIAQNTGGLLVYADTTTVGTPKYKVFDDTTGFGVEQSASSVGAVAIEWIRVAASPTNDQWIIATRDAGDVIKAQVCTGVDGGVSCGSATTITATAGTHGFRNYAVAYEQTSGEALLVYGTATVDALRKIELVSGSWVNDAAITTNRTAGTVEWVELTSRASSDEIGIVYSDDADDVSAYRWNGTTAANEHTVAITTAASIGNVRKVDVSFEGTSGDMLVAAALESAGSIALGALTAAGVWSLPSGTATDNDASFIDLQGPNPSDNDIAIVTMGDLGASNPFEGSEYDGTALVDGTVAVDTASTLYGASYHMAATAYVSSTYYAVAVFSDVTGADDINWFTMNSAGTWATVQADNLRTRGTMRFLNLYDYPTLDKVLLISADANSDLWADAWNGAAPSATVWVDRSGGATLEDSLSTAITDVSNFAFRLAPIPTTIRGDGVDPANSAIAPSAATTTLDNFDVRASSGTDTITALTVTLSPTNATDTLSAVTVAQTENGSASSTVYNPTSATVNFTGLTLPVTSSATTTYYIRIVPKTHASMPVPPGSSIGTTGTVTSMTTTNSQSGTDTNSATITVDNLSPNGATATSTTAGDANVTVNWTTSSSGDFNTTSGSVIYRWAAASAGSETPDEGTTSSIGSADGTATVACVTSSAASTAQSKIDGTGGSADCTTTALVNGTTYAYMVFQKDTNGNYNVGGLVGTATPAASGPNATDYTNGAEAGLNFSACATTGCGGRSGQAITVTGSAFGAACSSPGTVVKIGTYAIPCVDVSSWSATSITFDVTTSTTAFGGTGSSGLIVRSGGTDDASPLEFWVFPRITSVSPSGAGEGKEGDSITVTGNRFDAGTATGTVAFGNCSGPDVSATLTSWNDTSIVFTVPTGISDTDDLCDVGVRRASGTGSKNATSTNFVVLPEITSISATSTNAGLEYDSGDTHGLIQLNGKHYGTATGTVAFTGGFGSQSAIIHSLAEGSCTTAGWWQNAGTQTCTEVASSISDSVYTGTITLTRNSDSKTNVFSTFRVLPRITSNDPTSTTTQSIVKIAGNHFCQSGTCPVSPNRSSSADNVKFGSTQAPDGDFVNSGGAPCSGNAQAWTDAEICVKVPSATPVGSNPTRITSNTSYFSNTKAFSVASTVPNDPTNLEQFKTDDTLLTVGATTTETSIKLEADLSAGMSITMVLQFEVQSTSTAFDGTVSATSTPQTGTSFPNTEITLSGLTDGTEYHWRVRAKNTTTGETSNWVAFGGNGDGSPADTDFSIDASGPVISGTAAINITDILADITWNTNESANRQMAYSTTTCPTSSGQAGFDLFPRKVPSSPTGSGTSHTVNLNNLLSGTTHQYRVRSADTLGNVTFDPADTTCRTFNTIASVTRIMRTVSYRTGQFNQISDTNATTSLFKVLLSETNATATSAHIEVSGVTIGTGGSNPTIAISLNNQATSTYTLPNLSTPQPFVVRYNLPSLTFSCTGPVENQNAICTNGTSDNRLMLKFGGGFTKASLTRARLNMTYYYTP